jgi:hypothetical protein
MYLAPRRAHIPRWPAVTDRVLDGEEEDFEGYKGHHPMDAVPEGAREDDLDDISE